MRAQHLPSKCLLLDLPVELRLLIYDYALLSADHVTIATALKTSFASPVDSGYASDDGRDSDELLIPALPPDCEPVVVPRFDPDLLHLEQPPLFDHSTTQPRDCANDAPSDGDDADTTTAPADGDGDADPAGPADEHPVDPLAQHRAKLPFATPLALLQTNRQIRDELNWHLKSQRTQERKLSLYLTYPYGLLVFQDLCPDLLRLVRSVHISGYYYPTAAQEQVKRAAECRWMQRLYTQPPPIDEPTIKAANSALKRLTQTALGKTPAAPVEELELRIYHPGPKGNELIWRGESPTSSPICIALWHTFGGAIDSTVTQGGRGAGAWLKIAPCPDSRTLTQRWKRFRDSNSKEECEGWVVSPEWPRIPPPPPPPPPQQQQPGPDADADDAAGADASAGSAVASGPSSPGDGGEPENHPGDDPAAS